MLLGKYWQMPLYGLIGENLFLAAEILSCCPYTGCVPPHWAALWVPCGCICTTTCITLYTLHYASLCTVHLSVHCAVHHCVHCALCITVHCVQNCVLATLSAPRRKKLTHSLATCAAPLYAPSLLLLLQFHGFQREVWLDWPYHVAFAQQTTYFLQGCCLRGITLDLVCLINEWQMGKELS